MSIIQADGWPVLRIHRDRTHGRGVNSRDRSNTLTALEILTNQPGVAQRFQRYLASTHNLGERRVVASGNGLQPRIERLPLNRLHEQWERPKGNCRAVRE
jgi:hypothetical protein